MIYSKHDLNTLTARLAVPTLLAATALFLATCGDTSSTEGSPPTGVDAGPEKTGEDDPCADGGCTECTENSDCLNDPAFGEASPICTDGVCGPCSPGIVDCPCDDGSCTQGECVAGACIYCSRGDVDCVCRANDTCSSGAVCGDDGMCTACTPGIEFCPCDTGDTCGENLVCESGTCVTDPCTPGANECPCNSGSCGNSGLYCDTSDICRLCTSDVTGCPCESDNTCLGDNYCDTDTTCTPCPDSDRPVSCSCSLSTDCETPGICDDGNKLCRDPLSCAAADCVAFQICDDQTGPEAFCVSETCETGYQWNPITSTCDVLAPQSCTASGGGPSAEALACEALSKGCALDGSQQVVCVDTCDTLDCTSLNRDCVPAATTDGDATCGDCTTGYVEEGSPATCVVDTSSNCSPSDPASIVDECDDRNMLCVYDSDSNSAACEGCFSGHVYDNDLNLCVEINACGTVVCEDTEFCDYPQTGEPPSCTAGCPAGQAYNASDVCVDCSSLVCEDGLFGRQIEDECACREDVFCAQQHDGTGDPRCQINPCPDGESTMDGSTCDACSLTCGDDEGERARVWPFRTRSDLCLCETQPGYYWPLGGDSVPHLCDADQDGWINKTAENTYNVAMNPIQDELGTAILANFRCELREIDRIVLINEYGQNREVGVCDGELYNWAPGDPPEECEDDSENPPVSILAKVTLAEPDSIDADNSMALDNTRFYDYHSRKLKAAEVNSLTKACVSPNADYNMNSIEDLLEIQPLNKEEIVGSPTDGDLLMLFNSHFIELHTTGYTEPANTLLSGTYWIKERFRCSDDFPMTYFVGRDRYWEGCLRRRDADWDITKDRTGIDFGATACDAADGTCPLVAPLTTEEDDDADSVDDHDLCSYEAAGMLPLTDEPWLGMNHSSQFRCVQLNDGDELHRLTRTLLSGGGGVDYYDFNSCDAVDCSGQDAGCDETIPPGVGESQPSDPIFECKYITATEENVAYDTVGLVAVTYEAGSSSYGKGCINESSGTVTGTQDTKGWSTLCPGYIENPDGVMTSDNLANFGKLVCGCGAEYSGSSCEYSCPVRNLSEGNNLVLGPLHRGNDVSGYTGDQLIDYNCDPISGYCQSVPPDPGSGFPGGRQGFWLCGEFAASRALGVDGNPGDPALKSDDIGADAGVFELVGHVRTVPFVRKPLKASQSDCDAGLCFELF